MKKIIKYILLGFFFLGINQTFADTSSSENPIGNIIYQIEDKKDGINKQIFTKEELFQIFEFELATMLFLLSYVYAIKLMSLDKKRVSNFIFFKKTKGKD